MRILSFNATILIILLIFPLSALAQTGKASAPYFDDIIVTTSDTHLLLFGELRNSLTEEMIAGLHNGIPVTFSFFIELEENLPNWPDTQLTALSFTHSLSFDTLKDRYIVETEEYNNRTTSLASLEDAAAILKEINGLKIIKLSELKPDRTYRIRVKADLYKKNASDEPAHGYSLYQLVGPQYGLVYSRIYLLIVVSYVRFSATSS